MEKSRRIPPIQTAWRKYIELWEKEGDLLEFNSRVIATCEMLWWIAPYILTAFWGATLDVPVKKNIKKIRRKNRNR